MSQIWLKVIIFDPKSGEVIDRWEDQPLLRLFKLSIYGRILNKDLGRPCRPTTVTPRE